MKVKHEAALMLKDPVVDDAPSAIDGCSDLEQQMMQCGLCDETMRFMRNVHSAEKHLNDAFEAVHGECLHSRRQEQVSRLYHELFGSDDDS